MAGYDRMFGRVWVRQGVTGCMARRVADCMAGVYKMAI